MIIPFAFIAIALTIYSPANHSQPVRDVNYKIKTIPHDETGFFSITFESTSNLPMCVHIFDFPDEDGDWSGQSGLFQLRIPSGVLETEDNNPGVCSENCIRIINPYERINLRLSYSVFPRERLISAIRDKELIYNIVPSSCDRPR